MKRVTLLSTTLIVATLGLAQLQGAQAETRTPAPLIITAQAIAPTPEATPGVKPSGDATVTAGKSGNAQDLSLTPTQKLNHEMPVTDKNPTPPLTFPPSSACAFHGNADCEAKAKADAAENLKYGRTGNINGQPAHSTGEAYGSNANANVTPLGGLSSGGGSSTIAPADSGSSGNASFNPNSIGNPTAGTPNPSGTGTTSP